MTGLELLKAPEATAGEIADIISAPCPPTIPAHCDGVSCRECWLTWLTGEPIKEKEPPDKRKIFDKSVDDVLRNAHAVVSFKFELLQLITNPTLRFI